MEKPLKLDPSLPSGVKIFTGHGPGYVVVNGARQTGVLVVAPDAVRTDWPATGFDALQESHFEWLLALKPELVLLGTGDSQRFAHPRLTRALTEAHVGVECMTNAAACRSYNILAADGRRVVAALFV
jgi:uncharacterized protein